MSMARTIKRFWEDMKNELGLAGYPASNERICKGWRNRALTSEKKLAAAVEALKKVGNLPECKHSDDWSDNLDAALEICSNALAEIGGEDE